MNYRLDLYQSTVDSIHGCLAGGAMGDSFGFPYEGLTKNRAVKLLGYPFPNKLLFGYGMLSGDTEHACMTAISLIQSSGHPRLFEKALINQLRSWFLCLHPATGFATAPHLKTSRPGPSHWETSPSSALSRGAPRPTGSAAASPQQFRCRRDRADEPLQASLQTP